MSASRISKGAENHQPKAGAIGECPFQRFPRLLGRFKDGLPDELQKGLFTHGRNPRRLCYIAEMDNELKAILQSIVSDLEKTAAVLVTLAADVHAIKPKSPADSRAALQGALEQNKVFYEKSRKQIQTLRVS